MQQTRKISVTRALVELKTIASRIESAILSGHFVGRTIGTGNSRRSANTTMSSVDAEKDLIRASFQRVESLVKMRQSIKSAIVVSNANTFVEVNGCRMTVAEAIEMKGTVDFRKTYLVSLRKQLTNQTNLVEVANRDLEAKISSLVMSALSGDKSAKPDSGMYDAIAAPNIKASQSELLDPMDIQSKIDALEEEIRVMESEIDFVLSESNARTEIEVICI